MSRGLLSTLAVAICAGGLLPGGFGQQAASVWTFGIYTGPSPLQLSAPSGAGSPVLRGSNVNDLNVDTLAHPFMIVEGSRYYMFFIAKDHKSDKSGIGMAESTDGLTWNYRHIVVKEPNTLAHPFVFKWQNRYYMVPEAHTEKFIRLYRATQFPDQWEYEKDLLTGDTFISPTLLRYKDMWYMFTVRSGNRKLRLFYASDFKGPWTEHPLSPVVKDDLSTARPAGRPFLFEGRLYRLAQDCVPTYGYQVRAFQITELSTKAYAEQLVEAPVVKASSKGWNAQAMHHVDAREISKGRWIAAVDALGR